MMKKVLKRGAYCHQCGVFLENEKVQIWDCWCQTKYCEKAEIVMNVSGGKLDTVNSK